MLYAFPLFGFDFCLCVREIKSMGYQFFHVDSFAREAGKGKAGGHTIQSILAEAKRDADACPHVSNPQGPITLLGSLDQIEADARAWADGSIDARGHKLRKDGLCLLAGVFSAPDDLSPEDWAKYKGEAIEWLKQRYGDRLRCVIEHTDEAKRHCHFYAVPRHGERFEVLHPGKAAAQEAKAARKKKGEQNKAYCEAMRQMQNDFWAISRKYKLARLGPGKRRLTRAQWKAEKAQIKAIAELNADAEKAQEKAIEQKELWNKAATKCKEERAKLAVEAKEIMESKRPWVIFGARVGAFFAGAKISYRRQVQRLKQIFKKKSLQSQLEEAQKEAERLREDIRLKAEREAKASNRLAVAEARANKAEIRAADAETALVDYKKLVKEVIGRSGRKNNIGSTLKPPQSH